MFSNFFFNSTRLNLRKTYIIEPLRSIRHFERKRKNKFLSNKITILIFVMFSYFHYTFCAILCTVQVSCSLVLGYFNIQWIIEGVEIFRNKRCILLYMYIIICIEFVFLFLCFSLMLYFIIHFCVAFAMTIAWHW